MAPAAHLDGNNTLVLSTLLPTQSPACHKANPVLEMRQTQTSTSLVSTRYCHTFTAGVEYHYKPIKCHDHMITVCTIPLVLSLPRCGISLQPTRQSELLTSDSNFGQASHSCTSLRAQYVKDGA
jgi:hypothetical protein